MKNNKELNIIFDSFMRSDVNIEILTDELVDKNISIVNYCVNSLVGNEDVNFLINYFYKLTNDQEFLFSEYLKIYNAKLPEGAYLEVTPDYKLHMYFEFYEENSLIEIPDCVDNVVLIDCTNITNLNGLPNDLDHL